MALDLVQRGGKLFLQSEFHIRGFRTSFGHFENCMNFWFRAFRVENIEIVRSDPRCLDPKFHTKLRVKEFDC